MIIDPYEIFGLKPATDKSLCLDDVKKAYRSLAMLVHPDKGGDIQDMMVVNEAYQMIKRECQGLKILDDNDNVTYVPTLDEIDGEVYGLSREEFKSSDDFLYKITLQKWAMMTDEEKQDMYDGDIILFADMQCSSHAGSELGCFMASIPHGYGSIVKDEDESESTSVSYFVKDTDIVAYEEPPYLDLRRTLESTIRTPPQKLEDYSIFNATDYELAFTHPGYSNLVTEKVGKPDCSMSSYARPHSHT